MPRLLTGGLRRSMSKEKSRRLSATQRAVLELRKHRQWTQEQLAWHMGVALNTVSRWESIRPPRGLSVLQLHGVAREFGRSDLAEIFALQIQSEIKQAGTLLPPSNPMKPLEDALRHLAPGNPGIANPFAVWAEMTRGLLDRFLRELGEQPRSASTREVLSQLTAVITRCEHLGVLLRRLHVKDAAAFEAFLRALEKS